MVEPLLESIGYLHLMGYLVEADRWKAFGLCVFAGGVGYLVTIWALTHRDASPPGAG